MHPYNGLVPTLCREMSIFHLGSEDQKQICSNQAKPAGRLYYIMGRTDLLILLVNKEASTQTKTQRSLYDI